MPKALEERRKLMGWQLKTGRRAARFSVTLISQETGIPAKHIQRIEDGHEEPTLGELYTMAELYGLPMSELIQAPRKPFKWPPRIQKAAENPKVLAALLVLTVLMIVGIVFWDEIR